MGSLGRKSSSGFTLVEMMVCVAIVGILCATAIPGFIRYIRRAKSAEPREFLRRMYDAARHYYMEPDYAGVTQIQPKPPQFPVTASNGNFVASPECCAMGGTMERCQPSQALWEEPSWIVLHFSVPEPHYYAYSYVSHQGAAGAIDGSHSFTARARGNLDCDNDYSEFTMFGAVNSQYADGPSGTGLLKRINELE
jgi:prepilin-type N-terminal cleavage/methylation domain-containing protein